MIKSPTLMCKFTTEINPDCIKVCPFDSSIFCVGHYCQIEGENIKGAISILDVKHNPQKLTTIETTAILHLCWMNQKINDRIYVVAACRDSTLKIYQYIQTKKQLVFCKTIHLQTQQSYCLYNDCIVAQNQINLVVSTNKSTVVFYSLDLQFEVKQKFESSDHEYAVWCCRINPFSPNIFLSGDEISNIHLYDIRSEPQLTMKNSKIHENGVSDICFTNKQNQFLTGTFDGVLRWFDLRNLHKPLREYKTDGVLWRILIDPSSESQLLLCNSSSNTFSILNVQTQQIVKIKEHGSLAYAADWNMNNIVTASFYDKLICVWQK